MPAISSFLLRRAAQAKTTSSSAAKMGCSESKHKTKDNTEDDVFVDNQPEQPKLAGESKGKMRRSKSIVIDKGQRMRRTKSAVYENGENENPMPQDGGMTRRTSVRTNSAADELPSSTPDMEEHPSIDVGVFTHVGDPSVHANEDRATAVLDLLGKYAPPNTKYSGTSQRQVSFFGVYDGHGGSSCSEYLRKNLHVNIAKSLFSQNYHEKMKRTLIQVFEDTEEKECFKFAPGSCCTTVLIKGRKLYNATAGDSMAVLFQEERGAMKMTKLNDRHGCEFSKREIQRLKKANAEVSRDYETEGAVIARDSRGYFVKALYPTRGFGDADFKELVAPKPVVVATPTGVGVGYEGDAVDLIGPGPFWLLVGCDGLWDFMTESQIQKTMFQKSTPQQMAEHLVKVAQGHPYMSYDDVTCIVCKIEFK